MCLRVFFNRTFSCRRPFASYIFRLLLVKDFFFVTDKTRVAKFPFPALLVRPRNWKAQYVTVYSEEAFSFSFWYLFRTILLRSVRGESLLMRLHFENKIFFWSRVLLARVLFLLITWKLWFYVVVTKKCFGAAGTM